VAEAFHATFPDARWVVKELLAEDDIVAMHVSMRATYRGAWRGIAPTGRAAVWENIGLARISEGRIAEQWAQYEVHVLLE
jgi:predicted ester cyclase